MKCSDCIHWSADEYGYPGQHICKGLGKLSSKGFTNEGCSGDNIYCTDPDFFCGYFIQIKQSKCIWGLYNESDASFATGCGNFWNEHGDVTGRSIEDIQSAMFAFCPFCGNEIELKEKE